MELKIYQKMWASVNFVGDVRKRFGVFLRIDS